MTPLAALAVVLATAVGMEAVAALAHRYLMHGPLWSWHRSHHEPRPPGSGPFERNDRFALVFAALATALMAVSSGLGLPVLWWVGVGMTLYGLLYAVVHDGWVHRRSPWPSRWTPPRRGYLARLVQAHRLHHAVATRDGAVSFGFLYAPPAAQLAATLRARRSARPGSSTSAPPDAERIGRTGLALAACIGLAWAALLGYGLFAHRFEGPGGLALLLPVVALLTWLEVGLFIVAHDAMHGSLAPGRPRLNRAVGRLALLLYAGFAFDRFAPAHRDHHRVPGSADDPDFHRGDPRFWRWYAAFLRRYMGWREVAGLLLVGGLLAVVASPVRAGVFWMLPALLASLQLFAFGTWLPHRQAATEFEDRHRTRSNAYGTLASLATCFHFGYHLEHHRHPGEPWWRLPAVRRRSRAPASSH